MRVAHVAMHMDHYPGIARTIAEEALAARELDGAWDVWVASPREEYRAQGIHWRPLPGMPGGSAPWSGTLGFYGARALTLNFLPQRIAFARLLGELAGRYDRLVVRYFPGDLGAWRFVSCREKIVFLHHCKAVDELRLQSAAGAWVEERTGPKQMRGALAVAGVTPEIARHEAARAGHAMPSLFLPNGVRVSAAPDLPDERGGPLKLLMASSGYQAWQGLDKLLDRVAAHGTDRDYELHLVGNLDAAQHERAASLGAVCHGLLGPRELDALLAATDLGIASLAVERKGLAQAVPIKTRDYLARGVPCAGGHEDPAFPFDSSVYRHLAPDWTLADLLDMARAARTASRFEVLEEARPCIDRAALLKRFLTDLSAVPERKS